MRSFRNNLSATVLSAALGVALWAPAMAQQPSHPLDALTQDEITRVTEILREAGKTGEQSRYPEIRLDEPDKAFVRGWSEGDDFPRQAITAVLQEGELYEAVVDLDTGEVLRWELIPNKEPMLLYEEVIAAGEMVKKDERWQRAMRKRGYRKSDYDNLLCLPLSAGPIYKDEYEGRRILNVPCYDQAGADNNVYGKPIEGVLGVVDLESEEVLEVIDLGVAPIPDETPTHDYDTDNTSRPVPNPVTVAMPDGPNYERDGSVFTWDKWQFHLRVDKRFGPVLSRIEYDDRDVAYQLHASDMFVPYMDPSPTWAFKAYMDISEYGFGILATPLRPGDDCPANATFLDATLSADAGEPIVLDNVVCVFERPTGDPLWRHYEVFNETLASRPHVELVVRMAPAVGNYDYLLDFVFDRRGAVTVKGGAYGIDATKAVAAERMQDEGAAQATEHGTLIAPNLVGTSHDHYISFRVDLDVDGPKNRFVIDRFMPRMLPEDSKRRSIWQADRQVKALEGPLELPLSAGWFRVESSEKTNYVGNPTSYQLYPGHTDISLLSEQDPLQRRSMFAAYPVWITHYHENELFAAGRYPNQSRDSEGLPVYVADKESIEGEDLVLWYTMGFRHITRSEDWPAMPGLWHEFKLRPFNFFDKNPGMDVAPAAVIADQPEENEDASAAEESEKSDQTDDSDDTADEAAETDGADDAENPED